MTNQELRSPREEKRGAKHHGGFSALRRTAPTPEYYPQPGPEVQASQTQLSHERVANAGRPAAHHRQEVARRSSNGNLTPTRAKG